MTARSAALELFVCLRYGPRTVMTRSCCSRRHHIANARTFTTSGTFGDFQNCRGCTVGAEHRKKLEPVPSATLTPALPARPGQRKLGRTCFTCGKPVFPAWRGQNKLYCDNACKALAKGWLPRIDAVDGIGAGG